MPKLSKRLQTILNLALPNHDLWDIACDHGLVGRAAHAAGIFKQIYFVDPLNHRIDNLKKHLPKTECFNQKAEDLEMVIMGNFTMAGVGATKIVSVLEALHKKGNLQAERLILGPHKDEKQVQDMLIGNYRLLDQVQIIERGKARSIYVFTK